MMRPMMLPGMMPGMAQFQAMLTARHQARTLLYREALEELRKNPKAADLPACASGTLPAAGLDCVPQVSEIPVPARPTMTGRRLAVLFGNNQYQNPIPPLETPIHDVTQLAALLEKQFGYSARVVKDASKDALVKTLNGLAAEVTSADSVLLVYAGHGYLMEENNMGYWIPVDASVKSAQKWISNNDIAKFLQAIPARQLILVSDSCFSGSLTREQKMAPSAAVDRANLLERRSVLVLTSGGEEPVSDEGKEGHSIFAWSLIDTLKHLDQSGTGFTVYEQVREKVTKEYPQKPEYGAVLSAGHQAGGDFLWQTGAEQR